MKLILRLVLLTLYLVSTQQLAWSQKDIKSKNTKNHVLVKGTKVRMIPPKGFAEGTKFNGFRNSATEASIMVIYNSVGFKEAITGVTKTELEKQGLKNVIFKNIKVNSLAGLYITGRQSVYGLEFEKTLLFFGSEKESVVLNTAHEIKNVEEGKEIAKSINSIYLDEKMTLDPFANLDYYFTTPTFKFVKQTNSSVVYNVDGILPTKSTDQSAFIASKSNTANTIPDKSKFAKERLYKFPITVDSILSHTQLIINDLPAEEIIATGKQKGNIIPAQFYQVIIFKEKGYYIISGTTYQDFPKNIGLFRKMAHSFMLKK